MLIPRHTTRGEFFGKYIMFSNNITWLEKDDYTTPEEAWKDILHYFDLNSKIWLPFYLDGTAKQIVEYLGYKNIYHEKRDFYNYDVEGALIIDNPPYADKKLVIETCKMRGIPFALLLPLHTLERNYVYGDKDLQILIKKGKYRFREGSMSPPFKACWFCWGMQKYLNTEDTIIWIE